MRKSLFAVLAAVVASFVIAHQPAQAAGLLEMLFGGGRPVYRYAPAYEPRVYFPPTVERRARAPRQRRHAAAYSGRASVFHRSAERRRAAQAVRALPGRKAARGVKVASLTPVKYYPADLRVTPLQTPLCCKNGENAQSLIHQDRTLRVGDAFMTPQGLRVYNGGDRFIDYRKAGAARFASVTTTRRPHVVKGAALAAQVKNATKAKAEPAPRPQQAVAERTGHDAQGRVIRVIGPYVHFTDGPQAAPKEAAANVPATPAAQPAFKPQL
ncbi:MAG: hypothetical protein KGL46_03025 [Hyphomicrobiales bacterium]|nr:hypothetical protein [Hyphomicrobiales bacterium]